MSNTAVTLEDRCLGALVGLAVGDALGGPLEFMSHNQIQIKHGTVDGYIGGGWLSLRPGEWTDDTAMMLCLAESLIERSGFEAEAVAARYVAWARTGPKDIGNVTRAALTGLDEGQSIAVACEQAAEQNDHRSAGNGTIMRCAPLAILYRSNRHRLIETSLADARITHWDRKAGSCSAGLNLMLSLAFGGETDRRALLDQAQEILECEGQDALPVLPDPHHKTAETLSPTGYCLDTLECALWAFLTTDSLRDCLVSAVNLGGDADTIGAVAGALAGAHYGLGAIPDEWARSLMEVGRVRAASRRLLALVS